MEENSIQALAENAALKGNVECVNIADDSEPKANVENMEVPDNSINYKDDGIRNPQSKEDSRNFEPDVGKEENEPTKEFFDDMLKDDFLDSMAIVDVWNPDFTDESDTEQNIDEKRDDQKHIHSVERHEGDWSPDDRRYLKRDRKNWDSITRQDRNSRVNYDRQDRNKRERSIDRTWNNRDRQNRNSRDRSTDKDVINKDRVKRNSRERSIDRYIQNRNVRDRSADKDRNSRERSTDRYIQNRNVRDRSADKDRNSRERSTDRYRQNRNVRDRSTDKDVVNKDRVNRNSRERNIDRYRQNRNVRDRSTDKDMINKDRGNRNSKERSTDRYRQNRTIRDRSTDKDLSNKDRVNRNSRERNTDRYRQNRNIRDRSTDKDLINRDRVNRNSRERNTDRHREDRNSRDKSSDRNLNYRHRQDTVSKDRSIDREAYSYNWNRNTDRYQRREVNNESKERSSGQSSNRGDKVENTIYKYKERRSEESCGKNGERSSRTTRDRRDESKDITETGSLESRKSQDKDLKSKEKILVEVANKTISSPVLEEKVDIPKLDTCIKALDDLLPPGTEDEFILPLRDESIKLTEELQKIKCSSDEKQDSDKAISCDKKQNPDTFDHDNDVKDGQQRREIKRVLRSERDYKDNRYADKWEDRKNRSDYDDEADRKRKRTDYQDDGRRIRRSDSRENKRALSRDRELSRSERDYKDDRYADKWEDRKNRSDYDNEADRNRKRIDYQDDGRKIRRSDSRENKRAISRDRESSRSSSKRRTSLSRVQHCENLSDSERNLKYHSRDKQYKDSSVKYDDAKRWYRRSANEVGNKRILHRGGGCKDRAYDLSPISDVERLSTPTLSSEFSYSPRLHPCFCSRSRSRSLDSCSTLSSDLPYDRTRRKRSPFLKELERKLAENHNKNVNSQLTNFSFAAQYQNPSNQDFRATSYPTPAVYFQSHPMAEVSVPNYPPPPIPAYSQSYMSSDVPQTPQSYLPNFSEPLGPVLPSYSDTPTVQMQGLQPIQMPEQFSVPPPARMQLSAPPPSQLPVQPHMQQSVPSPSQPSVQQAMLLQVQSSSQMLEQPHMHPSMSAPSQLPVQSAISLPVQSPSQMLAQLSMPPPSQLPVQPSMPLPVRSPSQMLAQPHMHPSMPQPSQPPVLSVPPQPTAIPSSLAPSGHSQSYEPPKFDYATMQAHTSSENVLERKMTKNEKSKDRKESAPEVPPPPKISRLYNDKVSLSRLLEASVKVAVPTTKKETSVDPSLLTRCEATLFALQAASDPSFITPGPLVVQDTSRSSTELQYVPAHLRNYRSPLLRKPDIQLNFTNHHLFDDFLRVSSEIAATPAVGFNVNAHNPSVKLDTYYQSKHHDLNVKDPKQSNSSGNESKCPESNVKESKQCNVEDSKKSDKEQKKCSACLERANKIMIWNCTQTPRVSMKSVGIQVSIPGSYSEHLFTKKNKGREASATGSSKNLYTSEEYRQVCDEEESSFYTLTPPTLQKNSRQLLSSGSNSLSLESIPRKGILKSSSGSGTQEQRSQFSYRQMQSSLSTDFKAFQSSHDIPSFQMEHSVLPVHGDIHHPHKLTDLHDKDLPSAHGLHGRPNISYPPRPFRSTGGEYGSSYDIRNSLTSESRFESSLSSLSPSGFPGKSTLTELLPKTTFDYHHSDRPTPLFTDSPSCL